MTRGKKRQRKKRPRKAVEEKPKAPTCRNCGGVEDLKIEVASGELLCKPCRERMLKSLEALKPPEDVSDKPLTQMPKRKVLTYALLAALFITLVVALYDPGESTSDHRFATKLSLLECNDAHIFNATFGVARPNDPDYYFCSPYDYQPKDVFYQRDDNSTGAYRFREGDGVAIFKLICPPLNNISTYQFFVGDWRVLWKKCKFYDSNPYLYSEEGGFKHFCCAAPSLFKPELDEHGGVKIIPQERIMFYNETPIEVPDAG